MVPSDGDAPMERAVLATVPFLAVVVVFLVTGMVGLVTLASSAALRYPPSLQFLQLLSFDIAAAVMAIAALVYGSYRQAMEQASPQS